MPDSKGLRHGSCPGRDFPAGCGSPKPSKSIGRRSGVVDNGLPLAIKVVAQRPAGRLPQVFGSRPPFEHSPLVKKDARAIVVLGMHRGGTSVLAKALQTLGVFVWDKF